MKTSSIHSFFKSQNLLFSILLLSSFYVKAQLDFSEVYNSSAFIDKGVELFDQEHYAEAIKEYDKVAKSDIFYLQAIYEKAYTLYTIDEYEELETLLNSLEASGEIKNFPSIYIIYGNFLSLKERFEESESKYKEAEKFIPNSNGLLYNMAIMYIRSEQRQKSIDVLKKLVDVNPNNAGAHYLLGLLAYEDGRVVEGSLSMLAYLILSPEGSNASDAIIHLNTRMGSKYTSDHQLRFSEQGDDFSELELILSNELPLSVKYKLNSAIDDVYTRQLQAIMEYLPTHKSKGGFYDTYYVPWLTEIAKRNYTEHFGYYTLVSLKEHMGRQLNSQRKKVEDFTSNFIFNDFWSIYAKRNRNHFGKNEDITIFLNEGLPYSQGKVIDGKAEGKFLYVDDHGQKTAELNFLNDRMDGHQVYYYPNGEKSEEYNYVKDQRNGPFKDYYWNGRIRLEGNYLNDEYHGNFKSYYANGGVYCEFSYENGKQIGKNICYWPNGTIKSEQSFLNNNLNGTSFIYNSVGDKTREFNTKDGLFEGVDISYFDGKQIKMSSEYTADEVSNDSKEFFENNQIKSEGIYKDGIIQKFNSYNLIGNKLTEVFYDNKGIRTEYINYENNGSFLLKEFYKNNSISKIQIRKPNSSDLEELDLKNQFLKIQNSEGTTIVEGNYKDYKMTGQWKYFYPNGNPSTFQNYSDGNLNGIYEDYTLAGELNFKQYFVNDETNGLYEGYKHNSLYARVWQRANINAGPYQYFFPNGEMKYEGFFVNNEKNYYHYDYYLNGIIKYIYKYVDDQIVEEKRFDNKGNLLYEFDYMDKTGNFELKTSDQKVLKKLELKNGARNGFYVENSIDGNPVIELNFVNETLHGPYKRFHPNGMVSMEGNYYAQQAHGTFTYNDQFGNPRVVTQYLFHKEYGTSTHYYPNGNIFSTTEYLDDLKNGEAVYYNFAGKKIASIQYELDRPISFRVLNTQGELGEPQAIEKGNAKISSQYTNGKTAFKFGFQKGLREGSLEVYEENGNPTYHSNYKNDKLHGTRLGYHENGKIYKRENFENGDFNGLSEIFDTNGNLYYSAEMYYDDIHGEVKIYKNGKLEQTKIFDTNELVEVF